MVYARARPQATAPPPDPQKAAEELAIDSWPGAGASWRTMATESILIVRNGGLGDTLLLWPAVQALRRAQPHASIHLMGVGERCRLLVGDGGVDRALDVEGSGLHLLYQMDAAPPPEVTRRFAAYDVVVAFAAPGDYALAENLSACGVDEVHVFMPLPPQEERIHVSQHLLRCLVQAGLAEPGGQLQRLPLEDGWLQRGRQLLGVEGGKDERLVLLAPSSGSAEKNWPLGRWRELAGQLLEEGWRVTLLDGPADSDIVGPLWGQLQAIPGAGRVGHCRPSTSSELAGVLAAATCLVGNDSGPAHLAALLDVPTVVIFGPSDPLRWAPLGKHLEVVRYAGLPCSPCDEEERRQCSRRQCLDEITATSVHQALERLPRAAKYSA